MSNESDFVSGALSSVEGIQNLDEDTIAYVSGVLTEDPFDEDARSAVRDLIVDALSEEAVDGVSVCESFFALLDLNDPNKNDKANGSGDSNSSNAQNNPGGLRKLSQTITMKEKDVETFAMGLKVKEDDAIGNSYGSAGGTSKIAAFFANMIDPEQNEHAMSERNRRKARQKELRIQLEEEERQRAINEAMNMFEQLKAGENSDDQHANEQRLNSDGTDATMSDESQMRDVRLLNFDLPNLRGGGPNLLSGASLILARGYVSMRETGVFSVFILGSLQELALMYVHIIMTCISTISHRISAFSNL